MVKDYLDYTGLLLFYNGIKSNFIHNKSNEVNRVQFEIGSNVVTTTINLPVNKKIIVANVSSNDLLSINGQILDGTELHIIVNNISSLPIVITLPLASPYVVTNGDILNIKANKTGEINILSAQGKYYVRVG